MTADITMKILCRLSSNFVCLFMCSTFIYFLHLLLLQSLRCYFGMRSHAISVQHTVPPYSVPGYDLGERRRAPLRIIKKQFQLGWVRLVAEQSEATKEPDPT